MTGEKIEITITKQELQGQVEGPAEADHGSGRAPTGRVGFLQQLSSAGEEKGWGEDLGSSRTGVCKEALSE